MNGCAGCSACCQGMGDSVKLDPLDIYRLCKHLNCSFEELMQDRIELNVVDGVILPNLKMAEPGEKCTFLNEEGRCRIHSARPGICRLFPLGRFYEEGGFRYFLQIHECPKENKTKVKVKHWIDTPDIKENEKYILAWHNFLKIFKKTTFLLLFVPTSSNDYQSLPLVYVIFSPLRERYIYTNDNR